MPDAELDESRDGPSLYRIHMYLYHEFSRCGWSSYRRWRKLDAALQVLHDLSRELREQGQLNSPTMFTARESRRE